MIRPATPADIGKILQIWAPIIRDTLVTFNTVVPTPEGLRATLEAKARDDHAFLVAEVDGKLAGFATYGQFRGGLGYAHTMEHTIILAPKVRGAGLGRRLMAAIEDHAARRDAHSMFAGVSAANPDGVGFHAALGYDTRAVLPEVGYKNGQWLDLVLMQKLLT